MKKLLPVIVAALLASASVNAEIVTLDRIVAIVDQSVITLRDLQQRSQQIRAQLQQQNLAAPSADVLEQQALESLIMEQAQLGRARMLGLRVDDAQLDMALQDIARQNQTDLAGLREKVTASGNLDWTTFRENIRQQILLTQLRQHEVDSRVSVSEQEINDYLSLNQQGAEQEFELAQIQVPIPNNASPEQIDDARARINQARAALEKGEDFFAVAARLSSADSSRGTRLGWRPAASLPPQLVSLLAALKQGELTDIIRTPANFHIFKLLDRRSQDQRVMANQALTRHILIRINDLTPANTAYQKLDELRSRLLKGESFADLARQYSEDGSASNGGSLGWVSAGEMVPEFERAMDALQPGDISPAVRTQFGVHLIQVEQRRQQDVTQERQRQALRAEIGQRKADELLEDWLRQLREDAYVVIRLKDE